MNHSDHVRLLQDGIAGRTWADLGSGTGAFTLALADLLHTGDIHAVDLDGGALREVERQMQARFPAIRAHYTVADFTQPLALPPLDGIVMANSLHFVRPPRKPALLEQIRALLKPGGVLLLVEYNVDHGNQWVPSPLSYASWERLAAQAGFVRTRLLATVPSRFLGQIFSAESVNS
jgi:ubiquinone/menaquinone biosynthesis C-methylase UbiE